VVVNIPAKDQPRSKLMLRKIPNTDALMRREAETSVKRSVAEKDLGGGEV